MRLSGSGISNRYILDEDSSGSYDALRAIIYALTSLLDAVVSGHGARASCCGELRPALSGVIAVEDALVFFYLAGTVKSACLDAAFAVGMIRQRAFVMR